MYITIIKLIVYQERHEKTSVPKVRRKLKKSL